MSGKGGWRDANEPDGGSPFAGLAALRDVLPAGPAERADSPGGAFEARAAKQDRSPAKAVVRVERKGRGGKDVTVIEQLGLSPQALEAWCKALKSQLGCGGAVEGERLVLQGDLRKRIRAALEARGVRKIVGA